MAAYVSVAAISDGRMLCDDGKQVTFRIKDYATGKADEVTVLGAEFVNRFSLHILPYRLQRVRYAGMFQSRGRDERLADCRRLIEEAGLVRKPADDNADADNDVGPLDADEAPPEKIEQSCKCGAEMRRLGRLGGVVTMRLLSRVTMLATALAAGADELVLNRLRDELLPPAMSQQPLLDALTPTERQLESFAVLTLVQWRLNKLAKEAEAVPASGAPPPIEKAVA